MATSTAAAGRGRHRTYLVLTLGCYAGAYMQARSALSLQELPGSDLYGLLAEIREQEIQPQSPDGFGERQFRWIHFGHHCKVQGSMVGGCDCTAVLDKHHDLLRRGWSWSSHE